jgi:hypothetical protein
MVIVTRSDDTDFDPGERASAGTGTQLPSVLVIEKKPQRPPGESG